MFCVLCLGARSQNLVPNGGFEDRSECIVNDSNIEFAPPWFNIQGNGATLGPTSPDLFHECAIVNLDQCPYPDVAFLDPWLFGVPTNFLGCEEPKTGAGYAGLFCFTSNPLTEDGYREYLSTPLIQPMEAGVEYQISFWVSLAERSTHAIWNLQAFLSTEPPVQGTSGTFADLSPQFSGEEFDYLDTRDGWQELSWDYIAEGGENYFTIGNFQSNLEVDTLQVVFGDLLSHYQGGVYYYVDDVSIVEQTLSTEDLNAKSQLKVFPSPCDDHVIVESEDRILQVDIIGLDGRLIKSVDFDSQVSDRINIQFLPSGIYLVQAQFGEHSITTKLVKR